MQPPKIYSGNDSSDSLDALVFTLDPKDKYLPPGVRRARTTSAIQQRKNILPETPRMPSTTSKTDFPEAETQGPTPSPSRDGPTLRPQRSLISIFDRLRRTRSAGSGSPRATTSWHRKVFSRTGSRAGSRARSSKRATPPEDVPAVPQVPTHIFGASESNSATTTPPAYDEFTARAEVNSPTPLVDAMEHLALSTESVEHVCEEIPGAFDNQKESGLVATSCTSLQGKFGAPSKPQSVAAFVCEPDMKKVPYSEPDPYHPQPPDTHVLPEGVAPSSIFFAAVAALRSPLPEEQVHGASGTPPTFLHSESGPMEYDDDHTSGYSRADSPYATDENFSPNLASKSTQSGPTSPIQLSQPETPILSDFGDDTVSWRRGSDSLDVDVAYLKPPSRAPPLPPPPPHQQPMLLNPFMTKAPPSGFPGYSIPDDDQGSTHPMRKTSSVTSGHPVHPLHHQTSTKDLVQSWNDGSGHQMTALEELVDDLGYLGAIIE